jgi:hypothetical protein
MHANLAPSMSKRFSEFSRLYWQPIRRKRRQPRLHPAMRERMWKLGQSGNPSGVSKAYAEAIRERSREPVQVSPGAERTRRWRQRKQDGRIVVSLDVPPAFTDELIRLGWLPASARGDKNAIAAAFAELIGGRSTSARRWPLLPRDASQAAVTTRPRVRARAREHRPSV